MLSQSKLEPLQPSSAGVGLQHRIELAAKWLLVAAATALALPIAWISILTGLFLLTWVATGNYRARWQRIRAQPVALLALVLLGWIAIATLWSPATWRTNIDAWWHYRGLLLLALAWSILDEPKWLWRLLLAFMLGVAFALVVSYLRWFSVLPEFDITGRGRYVAFGGHTGFSLMVAFGAFSAFWLARAMPRYRVFWVCFGLVAVFNLFFVNSGRTGQIAALGLVPLALYRWLGWRGLLPGALAAVALVAAVYFVSPAFHERTQRALDDVRGIATGNFESNDGLRISHWKNTLTLIRKHPVLGGGTGSFVPEFALLSQQIGLTGLLVTHNPHNDYLMFWSQQGIVAVFLLGLLWSTQWRRAGLLPEAECYLTRGLLILFLIGGAFNSLLLDAWESHIYALLAVCLAAEWPRGSTRVADGIPSAASA